MGVGGQRHAPAALSPGKTWYPLYRRLSGPQGRSGRVFMASVDVNNEYSFHFMLFTNKELRIPAVHVISTCFWCLLLCHHFSRGKRCEKGMHCFGFPKIDPCFHAQHSKDVPHNTKQSDMETTQHKEFSEHLVFKNTKIQKKKVWKTRCVSVLR